jgi:spore germination protein GerM
MTRRRLVIGTTAVLALALIGWAVSREPPELASTASGPAESTTQPPPPPEGVPLINVTLFYGSADGETLVPVQREIALAEGLMAQGREILLAQLQPAPSPHLPVIPEGTALLAFYVTDRGDAFVDLSAEVSSNHQGGSSAELLTVYAVVNAVTANLPTVRRVQILINGQEADTLAGHVDLRNPLGRDQTIVSPS